MSKISYPEETGLFIVVEHPVTDAVKKLDEALREWHQKTRH